MGKTTRNPGYKSLLRAILLGESPRVLLHRCACGGYRSSHQVRMCKTCYLTMNRLVSFVTGLRYFLYSYHDTHLYRTTVEYLDQYKHRWDI